jgi:hypothetical protein
MGIAGHVSSEMLGRYGRFRMESKREVMEDSWQ